MQKNIVIGQRLPRHNAREQAAGKLVFGDDIVRPNTLFAKAVFSTESHAEILSVDIDAARKMEGVKAVITARDVPCNRFGLSHMDQPVLADDKVRYRGDAIAVVAAESEALAEKAARAVIVKYEPLPAVYDPIKAMDEGAPLVHENTNVAAEINIADGDVDKGFEEADFVFEETFSTPKVIHGQIEPHVAMAELDYDGKIIIWSSNSRPYLFATHFARVMKLRMTEFQIKTPGVGGGFGSKNDIIMEPWLAIIAQKTGRPVKMTFTREEEFRSTTVRHPYIMTYKTGVKRDGTITARTVDIVSDSGAYVGYGQATLTKASVHCIGPYNVPNVRIRSKLVYTNTAVGGAMRGFGVPQVGFAYEAHTESIARQLGMDSIDFRRKNLFRDEGMMPTRQVIDSRPLVETLDRALRLAEGVVR